VLELTSCEVGDDCISHLNGLTELTALSVGDTNITGKGLAGLRRLRQLVILEASQLKDISATLLALKGSSALKYLEVEFTFLSDQDFVNISTISSLDCLSLNHNSISLESLRRLSTLPHLEDLGVQDTLIGPDAISILHDFKKLKRLRIDANNWSASDIEKLKKAVPPDCNIEVRKLYPKFNTYLTER
jgi:hypothetical protein